MRILILTNNDIGLYKFRRELLEALLREKHEVHIALPYGDYVPLMEKMGCVFHDTPFDRHGINPLAELKLIAKYRLLIKEIMPDVVLTYTIKPNIYGGMACAALDVPYVANVTGLGTAVENGGMMQRITISLYRFGLRKAQRVFFQNAENRDFMRVHHAIKGQNELLPGSGVNLAHFAVRDYPNGDTVDFVFVARIMREKGIDQYLDAAEAIRKKYPETRFHICGFCEQDYAGSLKRLHDDGTIIYHGAVTDMGPIYQMSSCTVHPTFYPEGMSNVLLESCASARPIITTDRAGCREIVEDGVNGFVVKQRDSADLIDKIEKFLALSWDERRQMGLAGRAKIEREFDRKIVVEKYMKVIENGL
ncbi:MAG: glycosyltransferase family 4 protein [Ruminococcaceae bacterium]|nr:glycosyltransferase family 4 protein [Oscillospiraceae bacterium]